LTTEDLALMPPPASDTLSAGHGDLRTCTAGGGRAGRLRRRRRGHVSGRFATAASCAFAEHHRPDAVRFLAQASFGATDAAVDEVIASGYAGWIEAQLARPQALHRAYLESVIDPTQPQQNYRDFVLDSFWRQAITGADQLRQRVAFALSEIFVVSQLTGTINQRPRGLADYLDMLGREGFGSFRALLEAVSLHPIMGLYLSHLRNQKEDAATAACPTRTTHAR